MTGDELSALAAEHGHVLREVRDGDAPGLASLIGGVFAEYPGCVLDLDGIDADLQAWASHLAALDGAGWVLEDGRGRVVACVGVAPTGELPPGAELDTGERAAELKRLYVHADLRRQGIGWALVARVEAWAREHGAVVVVLWSDTRFEDAHRLYDRLGYRQLEARRDLHDPSHTTEAAFVRRLDERA